MIYFEKGTEKDDKAPISNGTILLEIQKRAISIGIKFGEATITVAPKSNYGPWAIHGFSYDQAKAFATNSPTMGIEVIVEEEPKLLLLDVLARRSDLYVAMGLDTEQSNPRPRATNVLLASSHLRLQGGYIEVHLTDQQISAKINMHQVQQAIKQTFPVNIYRRTHVQCKIEDDANDGSGERKFIPLGAGFLTHRINYTVKNIDGDMSVIDWGKYPTIPLSKHVRFDEDPNTYNYSTELNYTVGGDSLIDRFATAEKGKTVMKICNALTGCKQPLSVCAGRCARQIRSQERFRKRVATEMESGQTPKAARQAVKDEARANYDAQVTRANEILHKEDDTGETRGRCKYLEAGKCSNGALCKWDHTFLGDEAAIAMIECRLPRRKVSNKCKLGQNCIYTCSLLPTRD